MPYPDYPCYGPGDLMMCPLNPFEVEEDFADMVDSTIPPVDPDEPPPLTDLDLRLAAVTERLEFLKQGPACLDEYYRRWPDARPQPKTEAIILEARRHATCRGCGRTEWASQTTEGYCAQCWHHLGRKEVA